MRAAGKIESTAEAPCDDALLMSSSPPASLGTLSLCLIMCNGGLAQALAAARPFMDEMVVVDTASTDDN